MVYFVTCQREQPRGASAVNSQLSVQSGADGAFFGWL